MKGFECKKVLLYLLFLLMIRADLFAAVQGGSPAPPTGPEAKVLHLGLSQAEALKQSLKAQRVPVLSGAKARELYAQLRDVNDPEDHKVEGTTEDSRLDWEKSPEPREQRRTSYSPESSGAYRSPVRFDLSGFYRFNLGSRNDELAGVIFVMIGLVVVFAFVAYAGAYVYHWAAHGLRRSGWYSLGLGAYGFGNSKEWGGLQAARFGLGIKDLGLEWGLGAELGRINSTLALEKDGSKLEVNGGYGAAGPMLVYRPQANQRFFLEFLAGTSEHKEVHLLAKAMVGANWQSDEGWYFGVNTGTLMVSLKSSLGYIRNKNPYNWLTGLELGYTF